MKNTIEFLKTREDGIATYEDVRSHLGLDNSVKKLFKTQEFQRFMKGDVRVPYRTVYPDAEETEWKRKGTPQVRESCLAGSSVFFYINQYLKEKTVRVVKLTDITVEPDAVFKIGEEEEEEEGGKGDQEALERGATPPGVLDQSAWLLDRSVGKSTIMKM